MSEQLEALLQGSIEIAKLRRANGLLRLQADMQRDLIRQLSAENERLKAREARRMDEYNSDASIPAFLKLQAE